jgi:hypothetical protein
MKYYNTVLEGYQENMSETGELIIGILVLGIAILLTRQFHAWKIKRAYLTIIEDLKRQDARNPETAVDLPYARRSILKFGVRDHRPNAMKGLIAENVVGMTKDGRYYILNDRI